MEIITFEVGPFQENTYLLTTGTNSIVIDPGFSSESEFQQFSTYLSESGLELQAVVLTHAHVDHVLGLQRLLKDCSIPVYLNTNDLFLWENFGSQATMFGLRQVGFSFTPEALPEEGTFTIGEFSFECLFTPGHSPDHTALYFQEEGMLIAGDAIFRESIGRTDLYRGDFDLLEDSHPYQALYATRKLLGFIRGHGPATTIGHEKAYNPFVKG